MSQTSETDNPASLTANKTENDEDDANDVDGRDNEDDIEEESINDQTKTDLHTNEHESIDSHSFIGNISNLDTISITVENLPDDLKELNPIYLPKKYEMLPDKFDLDDFPKSYKENNLKESRLLDYCENFRRQYANLCPDRTRLLLCPQNECGIEKFVCTTINPVHLSYPELYTWDGAARFVADFLNFVPLIPSTELPKRLFSPSTTIKLQKGTCFEYTALLCSLLIGVGYDAYVVSGYATRECCYMNETREQCPYLIEVKTQIEEEEDMDVRKYLIKPPKDLTSKYEQACEAKQLKLEIEMAEKAKIESELAEEEQYKPKPDPLFGLRIHSWILILAGKREISESFFIETLTGLPKPIDCPMYLGIESVWNSENYWVNMQDCSTGISHLKYNLHDGLLWEYLLPSGSLKFPLDPNEESANGLLINPQQSENSDTVFNRYNVQSTINFELVSQESAPNSQLGPPINNPLPSNTTIKTTGQGDSRQRLQQQSQGQNQIKPIASLEDKLLLINLPLSWTEPIHINQASYELRYPNGKKTIIYKYCLVEKFAPYSQTDGLILRLTIYSDRELTNPIEIRETFKHRSDKLLYRTNMLKTNWITEYFDHGRQGTHLAEHQYSKSQSGLQANRVMKFYHSARVDGLEKREQTSTTMKEYFIGREDRMYYREVHFGGKIKKFGPASSITATKEIDSVNGGLICMTTSTQLSLEKIVEKFAHDPSIDADEDVAERIFNISEDRISLTYHIDSNRIVPCTREFIKPPPSDDRRNAIQLFCDTHTTFQVNLHAKPKTQVEIYNLLLNLLNEEEKSKLAVRKSEGEIRLILNERLTEDLQVILDINLFDTLRNMDAHNLRIQLEKLAEEERNRCKEFELDYLAPFLAQIELVHDKLTREQAFALREECLQDFKQRLIIKANIIQARFERETDNLQKKQQWYQLNQINLTKEDEQNYLKYCNDATFRITTLESMLTWHKHAAPQRYMALEKRLRSDPRLSEFLQTG